jgi:hypothetical protein
VMIGRVFVDHVKETADAIAPARRAYQGSAKRRAEL